MRVSELRNLGPACERMLAAVGITTAEQLREVGAAEAYDRLRDAAVPGASVILLWAIDGALRDVDWRVVRAETTTDRDPARRRPRAVTGE